MGWFSDIRHHLDQNGQPSVAAFRQDAVAERQIDEFIGLIKGITADGTIHRGQIEFLLAWLETNRAASAVWPASTIQARLVASLSSGCLDEVSERAILDLLLATVGGNTAQQTGESSNSTALPLSDPPPTIEFSNRRFCFTGRFTYGERDKCQAEVIARGGVCQDAITKKLNFLVIGQLGSRDWLHSTHGLKIMKAVEYRDSGVPLAIVSEHQWLDHLHNAPNQSTSGNPSKGRGHLVSSA